ncbi:DUF1615 domain-containing protein [Vogesella sp. LIG4]|uniref:DUF1615 domain-containing protein n=1 Tax=Vogesella sp. LIG4 TaxID=1192162 RepID=UPI0008200329|nr:DUF1615 domain-containing protein [Vogesella sp. LIG4]SCK07037.1 Protein of unknown function [Vogesella sp. LIG4]
MKSTASLLGLSVLLGACATPAPTPPQAPVISTQPPAASAPAAESKPPAAVAVLPQTPPPVVITPPGTPAPRPPAANPRQLLGKLMPAAARQRDSWRDDILGAFGALQLQPSAENLCAVIAVIEQESSFQADPAVPGLPRIVWGKIGEKAGGYYVPLGLVKTALLKKSRDGRSYKERIDSLRTEGEMNDLFEEMAVEARNIGLPVGMKNPIRTGGPMQVSVEFAEAHVRAWPYPYPRRGSVRSEVFSQRGGVYFGSAILLQYPVNYSSMLYRFADFNAGRYSSRNAAFQQALASLSGSRLAPDGDLLRYDNGTTAGISSSQKAVAKLRGKLQMSDADILRDLKLEKNAGFADSPLYRKVMQLADAQAGKRVAREVLPQIRLQSPKITRKLTTAWFAERVNGRYQQCLGRAG